VNVCHKIAVLTFHKTTTRNLLKREFRTAFVTFVDKHNISCIWCTFQQYQHFREG